MPPNYGLSDIDNINHYIVSLTFFVISASFIQSHLLMHLSAKSKLAQLCAHKHTRGYLTDRNLQTPHESSYPTSYPVNAIFKILSALTTA